MLWQRSNHTSDAVVTDSTPDPDDGLDLEIFALNI